jgi:dTDP-4-dehydrorhamnose 3,5-epimerase
VYKSTPLEIPDVIVLEPRVFEDQRGLFFESFNQSKFEEATGVITSFVQDNHSKSFKGVLRGLHYQIPPYSQGKLIRAVAGEIFDVAVDIRVDSPTYGKWVGVYLSDLNQRQLWIPPGFAHGFLALSETAEVLYKTTDYYAPKHERCIIWNDSTLNIEWPLKNAPILSPKDARGTVFAELDT